MTRGFTTGAFAIAATLLTVLVACVPDPAGTPPATTTTTSTTTTTTSTTTSTTSTTTTLPPGPQRYLQTVFASATKTSSVTYATALDNLGAPKTLRLDIYRPTGDTVTNRPAIVWVHGGGFVQGTRTDDSTLLQELSKMGYVVVSIDYRLEASPTWNPYGDPYALSVNPSWLAAVARAQEDTRAAVAWLRTRATNYGIAPERIAVAGASAGGITALNVAYALDAATGANGPTDPSRVRAAVSLVGATRPEWVQAGEPPAYMANGSLDTLVPTDLSQPVCPAAQAVGVYCEYHLYPVEHAGLAAYFAEILVDVPRFLYERVVTAP